MMRAFVRLSFLVVTLVCLSIFANAASAQTESNTTIAKSREVERGITGSLTFAYSGKQLRARTQREADAPISVRLSKLPKANEYELRFVGVVDGTFDLAQELEAVDGSTPAGLPSLTVHIRSTLPKDNRSDLFEMDRFVPSISSGYRMIMLLASVAWLAIPLTIFVRRMMNSKPKELAVPATPPPTTAEQLEALLQRVLSQSIPVEEKAQLELLIYRYLRESEAGQKASVADSIQQLRQHDRWSTLIESIERWLHSPESSEDTDSDAKRNVAKQLEHLRATIPATMSATSEKDADSVTQQAGVGQ